MIKVKVAHYTLKEILKTADVVRNLNTQNPIDKRDLNAKNSFLVNYKFTIKNDFEETYNHSLFYFIQVKLHFLSSSFKSYPLSSCAFSFNEDNLFSSISMSCLSNAPSLQREKVEFQYLFYIYMLISCYNRMQGIK